LKGPAEERLFAVYQKLPSFKAEHSILPFSVHYEKFLKFPMKYSLPKDQISVREKIMEKLQDFERRYKKRIIEKLLKTHINRYKQ